MKKLAQLLALAAIGLGLTSAVNAGSFHQTNSNPYPAGPTHQEWTFSLPSGGGFSSTCISQYVSGYANAIVSKTSGGGGLVYFVQAPPYTTNDQSATVGSGDYKLEHNAQNGAYVYTNVSW